MIRSPQYLITAASKSQRLSHHAGLYPNNIKTISPSRQLTLIPLVFLTRSLVMFVQTWPHVSPTTLNDCQHWLEHNKRNDIMVWGALKHLSSVLIQVLFAAGTITRSESSQLAFIFPHAALAAPDHPNLGQTSPGIPCPRERGQTAAPCGI